MNISKVFASSDKECKLENSIISREVKSKSSPAQLTKVDPEKQVQIR